MVESLYFSKVVVSSLVWERQTKTEGDEWFCILRKGSNLLWCERDRDKRRQGRRIQTAMCTHNLFLYTQCYIQSFTSSLLDETYSTRSRLSATAPRRQWFSDCRMQDSTDRCKAARILRGHVYISNVQNLDETDCISHSTNTLGKGMNPITLPPAVGK